MTADDVDDVARSESAAGAAFFDVDRTLLSGASALHMVRPFQQHGLITRRQTLQAHCGSIARWSLPATMLSRSLTTVPTSGR